MQIRTAAIIEYKEDDIMKVLTFSHDAEGIEEAKNSFKNIISENDTDVTVNELKAFVEDGYYEQGEYQLFLRV